MIARRIGATVAAIGLLLAACGADDPSGVVGQSGGAAAAPDGQASETDRPGATEPGSAAGGGSEAGALQPTVDPDTAPVVVGHVIGDGIVAYERPDDTSRPVVELSNPTAVGGPLAFRLVSTEPPTGPWAEVYLPVRPNGSTGWVRTELLTLTANPYRIEVDRATHSLRVLHRGQPWLETEVAIGTGATPTPVGEFYIIELLQPPDPGGLYGPFAFGLSGFSETLTSFAGGDGVIGIHGTNQPEAIGTDVSHGCIRVENNVISTLAGVIPLGTPVRIT
ncbi:MAG: L,D-transpeptidase [Actinomycetota bacterium]